MNFEPICQHEGPAKLARRDSAMNEVPGPIVDLLSTYRKVLILKLDFKLLAGKSRDRQRDPQYLRTIGLLCD